MRISKNLVEENLSLAQCETILNLGIAVLGFDRNGVSIFLFLFSACPFINVTGSSPVSSSLIS